MQPDPTRQGEFVPSYDYAELVRLRLEQDYDFRESARNDDLGEYARRPFSDVLVDLTTRLTPWLTLSNKTWYSPYESTITEHEHRLYVHDAKNMYALFGLDFLKEIDEYKRQEQDRQNIAEFGGGFSPFAQWSTAFLYRVDYENGIELEKRLILRYSHQCFSTEAYWSDTDTDTRFGIQLNLAQLGSLGR